MKKILITSKPNDADAIYVKLALEKKGHEAMIWYTADFPGRQMHSFDLRDQHLAWQAKGLDFHLNGNEDFDVVWLRRPRKPVLPALIHDNDMNNANNENMALFKTFWRVIAPAAFWVNPIDKLNAASCKLLQLKLARELGFDIPNTLISNDAERIRQFIQQHQPSQVIYKTLHPVVWLSEQEMRMTYTNIIGLSDLPSDELMQATPGIFQEKIEKAYELRVTYFGEHAIAVRLNSQQHQDGHMDWRAVPTHELEMQAYTLPDPIDRKCRLLMKQLGLVMGCFDLIVTPDQQYYFLEINEQGQFLWIEECNPEIPMLACFTDFLIHGKADYTGNPRPSSISLQDFKPLMLPLQARAMARHVNPDIFC